MENETKQEKIWRQFLLGDVTETERAAIEDAFLTDEENFVRLEIVEDELIEDYLHGDLTGAEKSSFESEFLRTAGRRERSLACACRYLPRSCATSRRKLRSDPS